MKYLVIRNPTFITKGIASAIQLSAETSEFPEGTQVDGEIQKVIGTSITIAVSDGSKSTRDRSQFATESQSTINKRKADNPEKVDVCPKWDSQPRIVSSKMPQLPVRFLDSNFKGSASIELALDESGQVMHASVKNASHEALKAPAIEATRNWKLRTRHD